MFCFLEFLMCFASLNYFCWSTFLSNFFRKRCLGGKVIKLTPLKISLPLYLIDNLRKQNRHKVSIHHTTDYPNVPIHFSAHILHFLPVLDSFFHVCLKSLQQFLVAVSGSLNAVRASCESFSFPGSQSKLSHANSEF